MLNNSLKLVVCGICAIGAAPTFARTPAKQAVVHSDEWKRHRAIEESIGRMQLDDLIASIVDTDGKHPIKSQRASQATLHPTG